MKTLILNQANIIQDNNPTTKNSRLVYKFPSGAITFQEGQKLALASISMYYSTFNITQANNNNTFQYIWVDGKTYTLTFPDGFYDINAINNFLMYSMQQNGHYLISPSGKNVFFIDITLNVERYSVEINCYTMNKTLYGTTYIMPTGGSAPAWAIPTTTIVPVFVVLLNNFRNIIGYGAGQYPKGTSFTINNTVVPPLVVQTPTLISIQTFQSSQAPQVSPLSSYTISCSLINNNYAVPNTLLYSFSPSGAFGAYFSIAPNELVFVTMYSGSYNEFSIQITDQNNNPIAIQDPNMVVLLAISDPGENSVSK